MSALHITVRIASYDGDLEKYRQEILSLEKTLRNLERGSPYTFTIIGRPLSVAAMSQIPRPNSRDISAVLNAAHRDIYRGNPIGEAWKPRVDAAEGPIQSLRKSAVAQFLARQKPKPVTRRDAQRAYAVANAIFSPKYDIY